jgi:hypothetical protein
MSRESSVVNPMDAQPDLFGGPAPAPAAYVVPHHIAVNTLRKTWETLSASKSWPWDADMKAARMERNVPKMLAVLPHEEADHWRGLIEAEAARLDTQ